MNVNIEVGYERRVEFMLSHSLAGHNIVSCRIQKLLCRYAGTSQKSYATPPSWSQNLDDLDPGRTRRKAPCLSNRRSRSSECYQKTLLESLAEQRSPGYG